MDMNKWFGVKDSKHMIDFFYNILEFDVKQIIEINEVTQKNGWVTIDNEILNVSLHNWRDTLQN